ncbi:hypothetical protein IE81DRAFT_52508 [Ceraceosorus guamensis]|uniref:Uncharacterized protein n=1 Tax=Ceraceosorus guamensis TaxID=1522189 RepID=A0A316W236_9BASI|nr:hypothetical protein IE81DRAFT_52508 [Ceraceosorus guamensis]PWN43926.1 hypothetical protein IE81DRAFT_52508 [Ceraceosorus guamensis]
MAAQTTASACPYDRAPRGACALCCAGCPSWSPLECSIATHDSLKRPQLAGNVGSMVIEETTTRMQEIRASCLRVSRAQSNASHESRVKAGCGT